MSTLLQIESAVAGLPQQDQWSLLNWLQGRLVSTPKAAAVTPEALRLFRNLQAEVNLTSERAEVWKQSVEEARR